MFLGTAYQNWKNLPNCNKNIKQMAIKCQMAIKQNFPTKALQIWVLGMKIYHLAALQTTYY
jgi:hypothetical protein